MPRVSRRAIVTGASSGVGRAVAVRLAKAGWQVAGVGRRMAELEQTASLVPAGQIRPESCDVADAAAVQRLRARIEADWDGVDAVVAAAGINVHRRGWLDVSPEDARTIIEVNLLGVFHVVQAFLPLMLGREGATIVTIVSDAGMWANAKAGASYVASKFGVTGLTESLNVELRDRGIRATAIFPGDINTPLLDKRAVPPTVEQRTQMLQADDVADCVMLAIELPPRAVVEKLVIRPR